MNDYNLTLIQLDYSFTGIYIGAVTDTTKTETQNAGMINPILFWRT